MKTSKIVTDISTGCHKDPAFSSIINNLCRSAPLLQVSTDEIENNRIASWEKEIAATQGRDHMQVLDYTIWFSDTPDFTKPLSPFLLPAPTHNRRIWQTMRDWRENMVGRVLYPQFQANKSVSRESARLFHVASTTQEDGIFPSMVSSAELERWYAATGEEIGGCCELRQAWKYNDLTPRTYFAQGGKAYHASKYIRQVVNSLTNSFPEINFRTRFSIHDLPLDTETTSFIYDYSSFTSRLSELKYFLNAIADFTDDIPIFLVDSRDGIITSSLGSVIREYNTVCNHLGEFSIQRYTPEDVLTWTHKISGFLGVYGNIASATTLHGLHACQLCGDTGGCRCVGDDAFVTAKPSLDFQKEDIVLAVQSLGEVNPEKIKWWEHRNIETIDEENDQAWPYVKRPLDRFHNRMIQEPNLFLPIFGLISPIRDDVHGEPEELYTRIKLLARQTFSLIRQVQSLYPPLEFRQKNLLETYVRCLYKTIGKQMLEGWLPFETQTISGIRIHGLLVPNVVGEFLSSDPWDLLRLRYEGRQSALVRVPVLSSEDEEELVGPALRNRGVESQSTLGPTFAYLEKMGWASTEAIFEHRILDFEEYSRLYELFFSGRFRQTYNVIASSYAPDWIADLALVAAGRLCSSI